MTRHKILLVEDDKLIRDLITISLDAEKYLIIPALSAKRMFEVLEDTQVDAIVLDLMLKDTYALHCVPDIRQKTNVPILILSARSSTEDRIIGLQAGVDDYISKPFEPMELQARIEANINRYQSFLKARGLEGLDNGVIHIGQLTMDTQTRKVERDGEDCGLTSQEFRLLEQLVANAPAVLSRQDLARLDDPESDNVIENFDRSIDIRVARTRKKIGDDAQKPSIILTVRGEGYQLGVMPQNKSQSA